MFMATAEILGRYVFNSPIPGHVETVEFLMAGMVFLGISYTERVGGHVRIGFLSEWVSKKRSSHIIESLCIALSLFVFLFILIYSFKATIFSLKVGDTTSTLYWPTWPAKLTIPIGSFLLCLRFLVEIIQHVAQAITGIDIQFISQERGNK
jgi:TRAP-type C4-dicarboxylate transport system permease small subunit